MPYQSQPDKSSKGSLIRKCKTNTTLLNKLKQACETVLNSLPLQESTNNPWLNKITEQNIQWGHAQNQLSAEDKAKYMRWLTAYLGRNNKMNAPALVNNVRFLKVNVSYL